MFETMIEVESRPRSARGRIGQRVQVVHQIHAGQRRASSRRPRTFLKPQARRELSPPGGPPGLHIGFESGISHRGRLLMCQRIGPQRGGERQICDSGPTLAGTGFHRYGLGIGVRAILPSRSSRSS